MTFANPIVAAGLCGLIDLYTDRAVTPVEACEVYLSRIAGLDCALGAVVHLDAEGARAAAHDSARRWRRGEARSLVDGAPILVKDNIAVRGWPWRAGVGAYAGRLAEADAPVVARLREAGAVVLGLANMHEGAFGAVTDNPWTGRTHNPWDYDRSAGGSSGGSAAAVAAGLCAAALGSDTLGSVRIPAAFCGVFGHKPTFGLIPTGGVIPMAWTLDTVGVHGRSAADAARLYAAACATEPEIAADLGEPASADALRAQCAEAPLGLLTVEGVELAPEALRGMEVATTTARVAGIATVPVRLELDLAAALMAAVLVSAAESAVAHAEALAAKPDGFSAPYRTLLDLGAQRSAIDLARALRTLSEAGEAVRAALSAHPAVILPTTPIGAFTFEAGQPPTIASLTFLANLAGLPACAFPVGLDESGRPRSVQAVAWDDETALGLAALLASEVGAPPAYRG